jgi:serine/threonine-protein kinase
MTQPIPDFRTLDKRIDDRLNEILQRSLVRDLAARYPNADELLYELEHYIYHQGYGPTNETLGKFIRELFGQSAPAPRPDNATDGGTQVIEHTARINKR